MESFLKGSIFITDNINVINNAPLDSLHKIISLDEDDILPESNCILGGTCLLPPIEAKIAEADGNEEVYDAVYSNHLQAPFQQQYIAAMVCYLYKGGNLLLFLPDLGYTNTIDKLILHMYRLYGLHIGFINDSNPFKANCFYDETCIPMWLTLIYCSDIIDPYEFLYKFPIDADLLRNKVVVDKLLKDINPFGKSINDKINYLLHLHKLIHKNYKVRPAILGLL